MSALPAQRWADPADDGDLQFRDGIESALSDWDRVRDAFAHSHEISDAALIEDVASLFVLLEESNIKYARYDSIRERIRLAIEDRWDDYNRERE